jgi:hypothetical protein
MKKTARSSKPVSTSFIPEELNTVTSVSKVLAAVLFVVLPFIAFYLGMQYQAAMSPTVVEDIQPYLRPVNPSAVVSPSLQPEKVMKTY